MPRMERSRRSGTEAAPLPLTCGRLWISWDPADWLLSVLLAKNSLDALSALSLHLLPAERKGCAVVSTGAITGKAPRLDRRLEPLPDLLCLRRCPPGR